MQAMQAQPRFLTPEEAADMLRVTRTTIYTLVRTGELPASRIGRQIRIEPDDLRAYLKRPLGGDPMRPGPSTSREPQDANAERSRPTRLDALLHAAGRARQPRKGQSGPPTP